MIRRLKEKLGYMRLYKKAAAQDKEGLFTFLAENNITFWKGKMTSRITRKKEEGRST